MTKEELYNLSFQLILHSGNARSLAMEAIYTAKEKNFDLAFEKLSEADREFSHAHRFQTQLIQAEAGGEDFDTPILLIHAQDHLMTAMTLKDLAREIIELRQEVNNK
ncbi:MULTISPECIES: PTS lactose/cellobiose transporter subunit IIA [unclassified Bacillus (in: firmicutes)]|uniref:PTS lactose/cellobiose transporter subunit IIA n=1 Tax=unclassified Bacillus (in: firmicutes) TaxID=185979 RepID=UPI000BEF6B38|nr:MULTISPECIES: PTS lactose/cellobiose transporter subunit IIA [unclassified Bacillus (in: firmicutes)]PEJ57752.1 PTS cellobiose transporter subunit IIA [Bacillus sp. AFS002410]PEL11939.1 PTS cellobiose transporter subunit IIA [Bacillus sp. AFS017336]QKE75075.1 PTS lactose/cellobiose transporter subunit IIA [Arthrobacter citreus]